MLHLLNVQWNGLRLLKNNKIYQKEKKYKIMYVQKIKSNIIKNC